MWKAGAASRVCPHIGDMGSATSVGAPGLLGNQATYFGG